MAQQEDAGAIAPEDAVLVGQSLNMIVRRVQLQALHGDAVVVTADETIGDQHVLGVARIDAVIVLHARAADLHVAHGYVAAVAGNEGPMRCAADGDAAHLDVGAATGNYKRRGAFAPLPIRAVENAAPENTDVLAFRHNASFDHGAACQIKRLVVGKRNLGRLMNAGAEVDQAWSGLAGARGMFLDGAGKQEQGTLLPVGLDAQFAWAGQRDYCRVCVVQAGLDARVRRTHYQVGERLLGPDANLDRPGHVKAGERVGPAVIVLFARKRRIAHARGIDGHRLPSGLDSVLGREGFALRRRVSYNFRGGRESGCEQARQRGDYTELDSAVKPKFHRVLLPDIPPPAKLHLPFAIGDWPKGLRTASPGLH